MFLEVLIIDLDRYPPPALAIEVGKTTLADDLGRKRLLYEDLEIPEYWVADVAQGQAIAFRIADGGSRRIAQSQVLPGFTISLLSEALRHNLEGNQSQVGVWLLSQLQDS